ncbi:hypothetical protein AB205_0044680 [Aquarana catesbeiana]|uniref:Uncharacterized protein n=1 Tax=Aquarana catesbeiana TaxID=8400 RepID=A0A2G9QGP9_AQUCT|nr:hypothetical protein AB205_0044680 [Aquarana catesbeiana]
MWKDKIMSSAVTALEQKFGTKRAKEQLRKRWPDLKNREPEQYWRIKKLLKKREKRLRQQSKDPRTPQVTSLKLKLPHAPAQDHAHPTSWRKERWRKCAIFPPHQVMFWLWKAKRWSHLAQTVHKA